MHDVIERLARAFAEEAVRQGGPAPFDADGRCLLPDGPVDGDFDGLVADLGRPAHDDEQRAFERAFRDRLAELVPDRTDAAAVDRAWRALRGPLTGEVPGV